MAQAAAPAATTLVGTVLSKRYRLTREIGRGGMGAVYAAEPVEGGGPPVAIKVLHSYFVCDEQVMTRFMDESRTAIRLAHPNILRIHECLAAEDGSPYLVMDLLEGIPLSAYTRDGGRVALAQAVPILQGMLAGIEAAHANGVVHRDLKPGNVFLARTGGVFTVKLLDFGIAKVMDAAGGMGTKTQTGALLGTPAYMSPEQVKSAKDVDARSDLWSIGVMFYEMLSGRVAFAAPTEYARLAAVISNQPTPIESVDPELAVVAPFLARALEKDRERRFQTAREMADALETIVPSAPPSVTEETPTLDTEKVPPPQSTGEGAARVSQRERGKEAGAAWSLVTDKTNPPVDAPVPATPSPGAAKGVLTAVVSAGHSSTLASPNRGPSTAPPPPAPAVVVVPDEELPAARARQTSIPPIPPEVFIPGVARPIVAMLVTVALALGFTIGVLFDRYR
jgi:serine/threonine-protein kinase